MGPIVPDFLSHKVVAVDGGANFVSRMDIWVGDADSVSSPVNCPHMFKHPREKAYSDLALALSLFTEKLPYTFHFWGFLGGRKDHELFNLGEGLKFLHHHPDSKIIFYGDQDKEYFHLLGPGTWELYHMGTFSMGCINETSVTLTGECQYPLRDMTKMGPLSSHGLSNEGHGKMTLQNNHPLFVYFPEGK